jgi:hypothetical protein
MKIMRTVSRLTSMMRAKKMREGSINHVYIVESKNAGIAISLSVRYQSALRKTSPHAACDKNVSLLVENGNTS